MLISNAMANKHGTNSKFKIPVLIGEVSAMMIVHINPDNHNPEVDL